MVKGAAHLGDQRNDQICSNRSCHRLRGRGSDGREREDKEEADMKSWSRATALEVLLIFERMGVVHY